MSNKRRPKSRPKTNDTHGGDSGFDYQDLNELHIPSNNGTQPGNRFNLTITIFGGRGGDKNHGNS